MMKNRKIQILTNLTIFSMLIFLFVLSFPLDSISVAKINPNVIYHGDTSTKKVSLMINVYWGTEYLEDMLNVFDEYNAKTTFFIGGCWASKNIELLKNIVDRGHELGNHGYNHKDHDKISAELNEKEIDMTHKLVLNNIGYSMCLFAPPSGAYNNATVDIATSLGYKTIMWTRDTIDWRDKSASLVYNRAVKNITGGDLVLMHPTEHTLSALPNILAYLKNNNFEATTVSDSIQLQNQ